MPDTQMTFQDCHVHFCPFFQQPLWKQLQIDIKKSLLGKKKKEAYFSPA